MVGCFYLQDSIQSFPTMKKVILFLFITLTAGLLLTNVYTSIVDARSWGYGIPDSVQTARDYFKVTDPGDFFRIFSPMNQFAGFLTVVLFWHTSKKARLCFALAFALVIIADIMTFTYFYPRNDIIFESSLAENIDKIRVAVQQWETMNWARSLLVAAGLVFAYMGLHEVFKKEYAVPLDM